MAKKVPIRDDSHLAVLVSNVNRRPLDVRVEAAAPRPADPGDRWKMKEGHAGGNHRNKEFISYGLEIRT